MMYEETRQVQVALLRSLNTQHSRFPNPQSTSSLLSILAYKQNRMPQIHYFDTLSLQEWTV